MNSLFPKKGSILVFSLIVLSFMLVSALSIAAVSVTERRSASTTEKSARSFQVADSGVEKLLQKIYKGNSADPAALGIAAGGTCTNGIISGTTASGTYKVSLYDMNDIQIACNDTAWRDNAVKLRSEGAAGNTTRAVEVAVAASVTLGQNACHWMNGAWLCGGSSTLICPVGEYVAGVRSSGESVGGSCHMNEADIYCCKP